MLRRQELEVAAWMALHGIEQTLLGVKDPSKNILVDFPFPNMLQQALDLFPALT